MEDTKKWKQIVSLLLLVMCYLTTPQSGLAQSVYLPLNRDNIALYATQKGITNSGFHSSIRPYIKSEVKALVNLDSIIESRTPGYLKNSKGETPSGDEGSSWDFYPLFELGYGTDLVAGDGYSSSGLGISTILRVKKKFAIVATFNTGNSGYVNYVDSFIKTNEIVPGEGFAHLTQQGYAYSNFAGY